MNREVVYEQVIVAIKHIRRLYIPSLAAQCDDRRHDAEVGLGATSHVVIELHDGVQLSAHALVGVVIIPYKGCVQVIVRRCSSQSDIQIIAVVHQFLYAEVTAHGVGRRRDIQVSIGIPRPIIGKRWQVAVQIQLAGIVVDARL